VSEALEELVDSLLYEGYALYPYTPEAAKNSTPTPFGIVYPPAYARLADSTFDHLLLECLLEGEADGELSAEVRFLAASGPRHQAEPERAALRAVMLAELLAGPIVERFAFESAAGALEVRLALSAELLADGRARTSLRVENRTAVTQGLDRAAALRHSLLSTHPLMRARGGRFISPLESGAVCRSVNTWPVLASPQDDVMLGAAVVLPDHPRIAPESLGNLFDSTEIEEALLLHVHALSDEERAAITSQDPAVAAMVARAAATAPEQLLRLHGRVTVRDPVTNEPPTQPIAVRDPVTNAPPTPSADVRDPSSGEADARVDGVTFRRGSKVVLRPAPDADLHARMLAGKRATIERIYVDYDGKVHLGVTVDEDPGRDLLRETGRFLFFFATEVEVVQ
jgi:hypothetical protein